MNIDRHRKKLLSDILLAIEEIDLFFEGSQSFDTYQNDLKLRKEIEITEARKVVNLRNQIIHGYDKVVDEVIWGVLSKHLPTLKVEVKQLLAQ